jgi:hypothetical protein
MSSLPANARSSSSASSSFLCLLLSAIAQPAPRAASSDGYATCCLARLPRIATFAALPFS